MAKRNAFSVLWKGSQNDNKSVNDAPPSSHNQSYFTRPQDRRNDLGKYLVSPHDCPLLLYQTPFAITIKDLYPKSSVHTLLLPRDQVRSSQHPFLSLENVDFLEEVKKEAEKLKHLVATEMRRKYGLFSQTDTARREAMDAALDAESSIIPNGRDWEKDILIGVHARPSMTHLHIHVLSVDRFSEFMRHRKHYNSFATPFFVGLDEFPLAEDDIRRSSDCGDYLSQSLVCWRCGRDFGNKFARLKAHLIDEFEEWKKE